MDDLEFKQDFLKLLLEIFEMKKKIDINDEKSLDELYEFATEKMIQSRMKMVGKKNVQKETILIAYDIIIDYISDIFLQKDDYQRTYDILNNWNKRTATPISRFLLAKISFVRLSAIMSHMPVFIKRPHAAEFLDSFKKMLPIAKDTLSQSKVWNMNTMYDSLPEDNKKMIELLRTGLLYEDLDEINLTGLTPLNFQKLLDSFDLSEVSYSPEAGEYENLATEYKYRDCIIQYISDVVIELSHEELGDGEQLEIPIEIEKKVDTTEGIEIDEDKGGQTPPLEGGLPNNNPNPGTVIEDEGAEEMGEESVQDEYTSIVNKCDELEGKLAELAEDTPEWLDIALQLIELSYKRLTVLDNILGNLEAELEKISDEKITEIDTQIEKYRRILEERKSAIDLAGIEKSLKEKIERLLELRAEIVIEIENQKLGVRKSIEYFGSERDSVSTNYATRIQDVKNVLEGRDE